MNKSHAIEIFGSVAALADALGIRRQAIYQWPDVLNQRLSDEVTGAAVRLGKGVPGFSWPTLQQPI